MKNIGLALLMIALSLNACEKNDLVSLECDKKVIVNDYQYLNAPSDPVTILESEINGDCLKIKFGASGCNGDNWKVKLVASESVIKTLPPKREVRLSMENEEMCQAYFVKEMTFDVKDLRSSEDKTFLIMVNADTTLLYDFRKPSTR